MTRDPRRHGPRRHRRRAVRRRLAIEAAASPPSAPCRRPSAPRSTPTGLYVAPGFIDLHSHSDYTLLVDPRAVSAVHQGVTLEVVGNCGFGCFPIRDPSSRARRSTATADDVPIDWTTRRRLLRAARGGAAGRERAQPRPERPAAARDASALADRPADAAELAAMQDAAARVARRGRLGLLDRARVRAGGRRDGGRGRRALRAIAPPAASTRRTRGDATRAPPTRSPRRSASASRAERAAPGLASRPAERDRGERAAASSSSRRARDARPGRRVRHAHAHSTASPTSTRRCRRGRSPRSPRSSRSCCATRRRATAMRAAPDRSSAPATTGRASSCSTTRSGRSTRAATSPRSPPSAARSRSTPSTTCCSAALDDAAQADGDHPRLHRGASSARRSPIRSACRAPTRRRSRPTARSPTRSSTARTPGRRGSTASWSATSACSTRRRPSTG